MGAEQLGSIANFAGEVRSETGRGTEGDKHFSIAGVESETTRLGTHHLEAALAIDEAARLDVLGTHACAQKADEDEKCLLHNKVKLRGTFCVRVLHRAGARHSRPR